MSSPLPLLPTTVIGSYSMPEWLERAKNEYLSRRLSRRDLDEMHDAVRKAAIKDQEAAGIDVVSDGEAQRDNMIDYFTERMPGVQVDQGSKRFYYDFYDSIVRSKLATGTLGLSEEAKFLGRFTSHPSKISISGPHTLVKRIQNKHYPTEEAFALDLGRVLNLELKELVRAGATHLQIDEPYYSGFPEDLPWALRAINEMVNGVNAHVTLHICYGNRYGKPSFEGSYEFLFPAILDVKVQAISMEFARRGEDDIKLFKTRPVPARHRRDRRQDPGGRVGRIRRRPDPPRARSDSRRAAHHQSRLRSRAPAARRGVRQAERDGRRDQDRAKGTR